MKVLALDPSGNFKEGKGTTGFAVALDGHIIEIGHISAKDFDEHMSYFHAHIKLIRRIEPDVVVLEGYRLYQHKAMTQSNSLLETPQLIGLLTYVCWENFIECRVQFAKDVKTRWSDKILEHKNVLHWKGKKLTLSHEKDAVRHLMHYLTFGVK